MKVISITPTRISFFGGGCDLPVYYQKYGGMVINTAINLRQHITLTSESNEWKMPEKANRGFYTQFFNEFGVHTLMGMEATFDGVIESGLGSSASAATALVGALCKLKNIPMSRMEIAEKAWDIENNKLGLYSGKQDVYASVWGGMNTIWFNQDGTVYRKEIENRVSKYLLTHTLLFYSGENRKNTKIQENFKEPSSEQTEALHEIKRCANLARKTLEFGDVEKIGYLLNDAWQFKKKSNPLVTNERIDKIYATAQHFGAWGGKCLGSGGGGYMIFMAEPRNHEKIINNLKELNCTRVDYSIDRNGLEVREI